MADLHKAIRAIHNSVVTINGDTQETIVAKDVSENIVTINWTEVNAWTNPNQYKLDRQKEYGSVSSQIEFITEQGLEAWKTKVQSIKLKYPKENS